ncbi:MAG: hypothetical protein V4564_01370 [Pseudomonadota bacterium]
MFGNVMNNKQISEAIGSNCIKISPFDNGKLKTIHYPLTPGKILSKSLETPEGNFRLLPKRDCSIDNEDPYFLDSGEFVVVEIAEHISLKESIVGHIVPASIIARKGLCLSAGRIEAPFGDYAKKKQILQFGLKNLTNNPVRLNDDEIIAYIYFIDLRGLDKAAVLLTDDEARKFASWTRRQYLADSDGVSHGTGDGTPG